MIQPEELVGGEWAEWFYWPLEQIDRKVRPDEWKMKPWERWQLYRDLMT